MHVVTLGLGTSSDPAGGGLPHYPKQSDRVGWSSVGVSKVDHSGSSERSHGDEIFVGNLTPRVQGNKSAFQFNMEKSGLGGKSLEGEQGGWLSVERRHTR